MITMTKGALILENGLVFRGELIGRTKSSAVAEVVFNTGMVGYQEVITDPSYKGQIVVMTYPLVGNYGFNQEDQEGNPPSISGLIVKEACLEPSNWRMEEKLADYLSRYNITGLSGIDTRRLTRVIREKGTLKGQIITPVQGEITDQEWESLAQGSLLEDPVKQVTTPESYIIPGKGKRIVVLDFGIKKSILTNLQALNLELIVVPAWATTAEVLALQPEGVFLSNGPGDPKAVPGAIQTVRDLAKELPIFGICLGHQILALSQGADTYKLKFGHRGINHPVKDLRQNRVHITSQNHGYAVKAESLPAELQVTHLNLNDGTVEGVSHKALPLMSVQYHPEAAPGPEDSRYLFQLFLQLMESA